MTKTVKEQVPPTPLANRASAAKFIGIVSIIAVLIYHPPFFGILLALLALALGITSLKSKRRKSAVTGISSGAVALFLALLLIVIPIMYAGIQADANLNNSTSTESSQ